MRRPPLQLFVSIAVISAALAPCRAPGQGSASAPAHSARPRYTRADVDFMQGMIAHHAQALVMTALVPKRSTNRSVQLVAQRIEVSQRDEIKLMRQWLITRHEQAPDPERAAHDSGAPMAGMSAMRDDASIPMSMPMPMRMPGMLTAAQLAELASTTGTAFDRLFLRDMIGHHEGALVMVATLLGTNGAAQEPEIFQFASDVDADQRAEIARMRALLSSIGGP